MSRGKFIFPVKPSPPDERDYIWEHQSTRTRLSDNRNLSSQLDLTPYLPEVRNQGNRGTCVAFASATIKEYQERLDANYQGYMSPDSVYFYRSTKPASGMHLRDAMKILQQQGISREGFFPYNQEVEPGSIPKPALDDMPNWKIQTYARITTIQGLKEALKTQGPCLCAFPVYDMSPEFWRASSPNVKMQGGHAVAIVGFNKQGFLLRNSWGHKWNNDGVVVYPYAEWGKHWEIWTCQDSESPHVFPNTQPKWLRMFLTCFKAD